MRTQFPQRHGPLALLPALLLGGVSALLLPGCGGSGNDTYNPTFIRQTSVSATPTPSPTPTPTPSPDGPGALEGTIQ